MYVYLARLSTVLLHRLETEARRAAFETAAATGAEAATRGRCADAGAAVALFLGGGRCSPCRCWGRIGCACRAGEG